MLKTLTFVDLQKNASAYRKYQPTGMSAYRNVSLQKIPAYRKYQPTEIPAFRNVSLRKISAYGKC